jgi:hypothetical protein
VLQVFSSAVQCQIPDIALVAAPWSIPFCTYTNPPGQFCATLCCQTRGRQSTSSISIPYYT